MNLQDVNQGASVAVLDKAGKLIEVVKVTRSLVREIQTDRGSYAHDRWSRKNGRLLTTDRRTDGACAIRLATPIEVERQELQAREAELRKKMASQGHHWEAERRAIAESEEALRRRKANLAEHDAEVVKADAELATVRERLRLHGEAT